MIVRSEAPSRLVIESVSQWKPGGGQWVVNLTKSTVGASLKDEGK